MRRKREGQHTVAMREMTVEKLDATGRMVFSYRGVECERFANGIRLEALWNQPPRDLGYARFEVGDRFIEWFYTDRWYNIFEIHASGNDALVGWYCNVAAPASIEAEVVRCRDLVLDLWVARDGTMMVLDEDEFAADVTLDEATRIAARKGLVELQRLVERRTPPFDAIGSCRSS